MARTSKEYLDLIQRQLDEFNWTAVSITCAELVEELFTSEISFKSMIFTP
jgi:DNA-binding CsgD family transcriptional regulator